MVCLLSFIFDPIFDAIKPYVQAWFEACSWLPWIMHKLGAPKLLCMVVFMGTFLGIPAFVLWVIRKPLVWLCDTTGLSWLFFKPQVRITHTHPDGSMSVEIFHGTLEQLQERERQRAALQAKQQG